MVTDGKSVWLLPKSSAFQSRLQISTLIPSISSISGASQLWFSHTEAPSHPFQWIFSVTLSSVPPPPPPPPLLPLFDRSSEFSSSSVAAATACVARSLSIIPCVARAPSLLLLRVQFFCTNFSFLSHAGISKQMSEEQILRDDIKFGGKAQTAFHERYQVSGQTSGCMVIYTGCRGSASCKMTNARGEVKYPIKGINILKAHGKSARDGFLMNGFPLNTGRAAQGMPLKVAPAKIACLDFNLQKTKMQLGVQVLVTDPRELEKICQRSPFFGTKKISGLAVWQAGRLLSHGNAVEPIKIKIHLNLRLLCCVLGSPGIEDSDKSEAHLTSAAASVEDVESMERNGYENPSLPTVPETHYVETASHSIGSPRRTLSLVATTSSSKLGRESFIDLNLPAPAEQDDANQFENSAISDAEFVNSAKALDTFNTAVVSPIYCVMFTTLTILASVIMFKLRNEVNKLEERLGVTDDHLKQKNMKIKKLANEKKCALATQYAAEATLRRVHANQKDDDILPIDSIITPFEAEIKIYKNELQIM
ncbi:T-complex protein 1 subunit alpha [Arachis hypogaea]|nr:T-complex protein 1 subunit alpha [Arachis hypogaea]